MRCVALCYTVDLEEYDCLKKIDWIAGDLVNFEILEFT